MPKEFRGHLTFNFSNDGLVYAADRMANRIDVTHTNRDYLGVITAIGPDATAVERALAAARTRESWLVTGSRP